MNEGAPRELDSLTESELQAEISSRLLAGETDSLGALVPRAVASFPSNAFFRMVQKTNETAAFPINRLADFIDDDDPSYAELLSIHQMDASSRTRWNAALNKFYYDFTSDFGQTVFSKRDISPESEDRLSRPSASNESFTGNHKPRPHTKPRVFISCAWLPVGLTSSHLAIISEILKIYDLGGLDVHILTSRLPPTSIPRGQRIDVGFPLQTSKVADAISRQSGVAMRSVRLEQLGIGARIGGSTGISLLVRAVSEDIARLEVSEQDIFIGIGGVLECTFTRYAFSRSRARTFYFTMNAKNSMVAAERDFDYVLHSVIEGGPAGDQTTHDPHRDRRILGRVPTRPFVWELEAVDSVSGAEADLLKDLQAQGSGKLLISAGNGFFRLGRCDSGFVRLCIDLIEDQEDVSVLFIGDTAENAFDAFPALEKYRPRLIFLQRAERLFSLYRSIAQSPTINAVYAYPEHTGSGRTNAFAALSGIPVILFEDNDANRVLTNDVFARDYPEMSRRIKALWASEPYRTKYAAETMSAAAASNEEAGRLYINLIDPSQFPRRRP